jgi:hypothetical protein
MGSRTKTATQKPVTPSPTPAAAPPPTAEFDAWAASFKKKVNCAACNSESISQTVVALLTSMAKKRAFKITVREIHQMVCKKHPTWNVGQRGLERHLLTCVRGLYDRARGRING